MSTLLFLDTEVPDRDAPGTPAFVFYDNGDWEIAFAGDLDYIKGSSAYLGSATMIEVIDYLNTDYDLELVDENDGTAFLYTSIEITEEADNEPLIVLHDDGEFDIYERAIAVELVNNEDSGVYNFVSLVEVFEELERFLRRRIPESMDDGRDDDDAGDEE